jgi:hypothetical protein
MPNRVIRSQTISIGELLRLGSFQPARVQRDYCWTEHQQAALLNDLIASFGEFGLDPDSEPDVVPVEPRDGEGDLPFDMAEYDREMEATAPFCFVGTVILHQGAERWDVYDGLQRVTTFSVFFAVLRDLLQAERGHPIHSLLADDSGIWRLNLHMRHNTLEADILAPGRTAKRHRPHPNLTEASDRLRDCVAVARARFQGWSKQRLTAFTDFMSQAVMVTVTRITDRRIAAKAFVSINSGGIPLKPEEIVKGQLIDLTSALPDADDAAGRVLFVWRSLQDDLGKTKFDEFLRSVDFIERRAPQSSDYAIQLMEHIRRRYPGQHGVRWATDVLLQYRSAFKWIYEASSAEMAEGVHASLRRLQMLKWDQWRAYAMLIKIKSLPTDIDARIDVLDRVCFALTVSTPDQRRVSEMMGRPRRALRQRHVRQAGRVHIQPGPERPPDTPPLGADHRQPASRHDHALDRGCRSWRPRAALPDRSALVGRARLPAQPRNELERVRGRPRVQPARHAARDDRQSLHPAPGRTRQRPLRGETQVLHQDARAFRHGDRADEVLDA